MARTLTTANAVLTLSCPTLDIPAVQIQGFATDDAFDFPTVKPVEAVIGVDKQKSAGFVAFLVPFKFMLQANSLSIDVMETIEQGIEQMAEDVEILGSLEIPAVGKLWTMLEGSLTSFKPGPQGKKLLGPQDYEITWGQVIPAQV